MSFTTWGPALDAEIAYRQERARLSWPRSRRAVRRTEQTATRDARPATPAAAPRTDAAPPAATPLHALTGGGARLRSLPGSEAWPAA